MAKPHCDVWPRPAPVPGLAPGLEFLASMDLVYVKQSLEICEVLTCIETHNRFRIFNHWGQQVYYAYEESNFCLRQICGHNRGLTYNVEYNSQLVWRIKRPFRLNFNGFCPFAMFRYYASVEDSTGRTLGYISDVYTNFCQFTFAIYDPSRLMTHMISLPGLVCDYECHDCCKVSDLNFSVVNVATGNEVGVIAWQWPGFRTFFKITFPMDMDTDLKTLMVSAAFVIDMMIFERNN